MDPSNTHADYESLVRERERRLPWLRRRSARLGLQGKLIIAFMSLLTLGILASGWVYLSQTSAELDQIMAEQASQLAYAVSMASSPALEAGRRDDLGRIGHDLLKTRSILFVAFFDANHKPLEVADRDPDFHADGLSSPGPNHDGPMLARRRHSQLFGDYTVVCSPIRKLPSARDPEASVATSPVLGYVAVGLSQAQEEWDLQRIDFWAATVGAMAISLCLPVTWFLVHRIFLPIRELVGATRRIAAGELDTCVAVDRSDTIGTLARSFNEMVKTVKRQRDDLAAANQKLARANRDLEQVNQDLESKVLQRTAELEAANRRLSTEIAEKEDFLRAVSHDLGAPLRNISGLAGMLLLKHRERLDEEIVHRLERIQKNVEMETDLIGELLELSRIKTRRQKFEPVEVSALVAEVAGALEADLRNKNISLVVEHPLPVVYCERARLRQVFLNLIDNAVKYMGDVTQRQIHVGYVSGVSEAQFYVRDTGVGIDPADAQRIFVVFRRGKNSATSGAAGKGVGLASVKSIIETYQGRIWVESRIGQGSTFRFTLHGKYLSPNFAEEDAAGEVATIGAEGIEGEREV